MIGLVLAWASAGQIIRFLVLHQSIRSHLLNVAALAGAVALYSLLAAVVLAVARRIGDRTAGAAVVGVLALAVGQFVVSYHYLGPGLSDADEALDILADSLIHPANPYLQRTSLGNTLSPMMGAGLIAVPFRLLFGHAAYQNPALFLLVAVGLWRWWGPKVALAAAVLTLSCLGFTADYSLGGDYYAGGMLACAASFALLRAIEGRTCWRYPLAAVFGLTVSSRASTVLVLALLIAVVVGAGLVRRSIAPMSIAVGTSLVMWVPWFLADPRAYAPLQRAQFLGPPMVGWTVFALIAAVLGFACAWRRIPCVAAAQPWTVLAGCGLGLAFALLPIGVWSLYSIYRAAPFLFFAAPVLVRALPFAGYQPFAMHNVEDGPSSGQRGLIDVEYPG